VVVVASVAMEKGATSPGWHLFVVALFAIT
jgi:hypothetical protein